MRCSFSGLDSFTSLNGSYFPLFGQWLNIDSSYSHGSFDKPIYSLVPIDPKGVTDLVLPQAMQPSSSSRRVIKNREVVLQSSLPVVLRSREDGK
uniref:Uncharacterized protein n=1 Tax=Cannabis sativa TaxID=3483 RepID=A0A803Q077_CANSA